MPAHSAAWHAQEAKKFAAAEQLVAGESRVSPMTGQVLPNVCLAGDPGCAGAPLPSQAYVTKNQHAQNTSYYCGPASLHELLGQKSKNSTQDGLANQLKTTTSGTAWYGVYVNTSPSTGWPVEDVLNNRFSGTAVYNSIGVDYTPTSTQKSKFQTRLQGDIASGWPLVGDAYEVSGGPHLVGHPVNETIFHYFDIRGYSNSGGTTAYEDSVHGASSISWSGSVPAYSNMSSDTIVTILGGRGYVW